MSVPAAPVSRTADDAPVVFVDDDALDARPPGRVPTQANLLQAARRERDALDEGKAQLRSWSPGAVLQVLVDAEKVIADLRGTRPAVSS